MSSTLQRELQRYPRTGRFLLGRLRSALTEGEKQLMPRRGNDWEHWLHVSKYPPSLSYFALELGILCLALGAMRAIELRVRAKRNGVLLVFGETAMFFYLAHRLVLEVPATYFGLRGFGDIYTTYIVAAVLLVALYPACLWYRDFKAAHRNSILKYF